VSNSIGDKVQFVTTERHDIDGDGHEDNIDNCPEIYNKNQYDKDEDTIGNACDDCPDDPLNTCLPSGDVEESPGFELIPIISIPTIFVFYHIFSNR